MPRPIPRSGAPRPPDPAPPPAAALLALPALALLGAALSLALAAVHYGVRFGDLELGAACGRIGWSDCGGVVSSRFGTWLGLPVAAWGLAFHVAAAALGLGVALSRPAEAAAYLRPLLALLAAGVVADLGLAASMARLGRLCALCLGVHLADVAMLVLAAKLRRRLPAPEPGEGWPLPRPGAALDPRSPSRERHALRLVLAGLGAGGACLALGVALALSTRAATLERQRAAALVEFVRSDPGVPVPDGGRPARGPADAPLTLVVFSDFTCVQCRRASRWIDVVAANHARDLRVVHRTLPADSACAPGLAAGAHPGACRLALAAHGARRLGRGWEFHDAVFADESPSAERIDRYARRAGLDPAALAAAAADPAAQAALAEDVAAARSLGVTVTPTLFLEGRAIAGALEPGLLEQAIAALPRTGRRAAR